MKKSRLLKAITAAALFAIYAAYIFTQALKLPLTDVSAERVLYASRILSGEASLLSWRYGIIDLPVNLLFVKLLGVGTYAAVCASAVMYLLLFAGGLLILRLNGILSPMTALIWLTLAGMPDTGMFAALTRSAGPCLCLLWLVHFIAGKNIRGVIPTLIVGVLSTGNYPPVINAAGNDPLGAVRALQAVFRADFSNQPLFRFETGRYFLMTLVLLLTVCVTLYRLFRGGWTLSRVCAFGIALTFVFCCLPIGGDAEVKPELCAWIPFAAGLMLAYEYVHSGIGEARCSNGRVPVRVLICLFCCVTVFFGMSTVVRSRPASEWDLTAAEIADNGWTAGLCEEEHIAVMTVACKGNVRFTADASDPDVQFEVNNWQIVNPSSE